MELSKMLPMDIKVNLYSILKKSKQAKSTRNVRIMESQHISHKYFDQIRQMWQGADDNYKGNYIDYFKECHGRDINPVPTLFKHLQDNCLYLKGLRVSFEQAAAIKKILLENAKLEENTTPEDNPFLIKTLVIDDCDMDDKIFEQILMGLRAQSCIRNIHYVNHNTLGPRSANILSEICRRDGQDNPLQELNLSSIKLERPADAAVPSVLIQITQIVEDTNLIRKLKLANVNLNDSFKPPPAEPGQPPGEPTSTLQNVIDILNQNPYITYLNVSCCSLELPDLVRIAETFPNCTKMEFLSIAGNQILSHSNKVLKEELVQHICDLIEGPQSPLRHLDISDIGFDTHQLRKILKALRKSTGLLSINLGHYELQEQTDMIREVLQLQEYKNKITFPSEFTSALEVKT